MLQSNHYELLQISEDASSEVIKAAYKALAHKFHPDRNGSIDATQQFQLINSAYRVLIDPALRSGYDLELKLQRDSVARQTESVRFTQPRSHRNQESTASDATQAHIARGDGQEAAEVRSKAQRSLVWGGIIFVVALGISLGTYFEASEKGGRYVVLWGAVVFGAFKVLFALVALFRRQSTPVGRRGVWVGGLLALIAAAIVWSIIVSRGTREAPIEVAPLVVAPGIAPAGSEALRQPLQADSPPPKPTFESNESRLQYLRWLGATSERLRPYIAEHHTRIEFLETVWFESRRAGLPTHLVLAYIHEASGFRKFAIDSSGARGFMQILPEASGLLGDGDARRLFHAQTNLRLGCVLMRHQLDNSNGDVLRALETVARRYSGKADSVDFANQVIARGNYWKAPGEN
jgi:hypothetical protein